jgi:hypothetical protein
MIDYVALLFICSWKWTHFVLECPLYNSIRDKFQSLFERVELGSLTSFFSLDHQIYFSLYLTEATALCHFVELAGSTPSMCTFSLISLSASRTLKSISFHFIGGPCKVPQRGTKNGVWSFFENFFYQELISWSYNGAYLESWVRLLGPPLFVLKLWEKFRIWNRVCPWDVPS